jgi:hypothetical protein
LQQKRAEDEAVLQGMVARVRQGLPPTATEPRQPAPSASYVSATTFFNSGQLSPDMLTRVWEATMRKGYSTPLQIYGQSLLDENNPPPAKVRYHANIPRLGDSISYRAPISYVLFLSCHVLASRLCVAVMV